ncbi:MAG: hypothetical protein NZ811_07145 [Gammaproteobacteria bacterium]|nr:hypothetical protein [Gammaproteobacteria bacterium]
MAKGKTKTTHGALLACEAKGGNIANGKCVGTNKKKAGTPLDKLKIKVKF